MKSKTQENVIVIEGIEILVRRKDVKYIRLYVKAPDGRVELSAPKRQSDENIERFVRLKLDWIKKHREKFSRRQTEPINYESGDILYLWGRPYVLNVEYAKKYSFKIQGDAFVLTAPRDSTPLQRKKFLNARYAEIFSAATDKLMPKWENITGLHADSLVIRNMTSRWGSCNIEKRKICLNLRLVQFPEICLEYVILHELAHLIERSHNAEFKKILDRFMPQWRSVRKILNG